MNTATKTSVGIPMHNRNISKNENSERYRLEADACFNNNKLSEASVFYELSIQINQYNIKALNNFAVLSEELGNNKKAEQLYKQACTSPDISSSDKLKSMENLAGIQEKNGIQNSALWTYQSAAKIEGFSIHSIAFRYLNFLHSIHLKSFDAAVYSSLNNLYKNDTIDKHILTKIYFSQLALKLKQMEGSPLENTERALEILETDNTTTNMISENLITSHIIEKVITAIRKLLLSSIVKENYKNSHTAILKAINKQCKLNEHIYPTDNEELSTIKQLKVKILESPPRTNEVAKLIIDSYSVNGIIKKPYKTPTKNHSLYRTSMIDGASADKHRIIRSFYEANPYPTWTSKPRNTTSTLQELFTSLNTKPPEDEDNNILVAGCGTGRHAIQLALTYPQASIKAIDISATSLEYASRKRDEYNIKNLEFIHSDLNDIHLIGIKFSLIECIGVLHHLPNPLKGCQTILSSLNETGIAKIGLYSTSARFPITELKILAASNEITYEQKNLETIRMLAMSNYNHGRISEIVNSPDFFSRSGCMDLLFHPLETTFSATDIYTLIKKLKCQFSGFEKGGLGGSPSIAKFKNNTGLENFFNEWARFEEMNPTFFSEMYLFWLKPIKRIEQ